MNSLRLVIAVVMLAVPHSALAQEARATITGTVADASGGVLPGATVTITNVAMGTSVSVATNDEGFFNAPFLLPGEYQVAAEMSGFKKLVREGIRLSVAD